MNDTTKQLMSMTLPTFPDLETAKGYLAGIVSGEGSVSDKKGNRRLRITNTELSLILACIAALKMMNVNQYCIVHTFTKKGKDCWNISVGNMDELEKLKCLTFHHPLKDQTLQGFKNLRRKYTPEKIAKAKELRAQGLTYKQIGDILGTTNCAISNWLKRAA